MYQNAENIFDKVFCLCYNVFTNFRWRKFMFETLRTAFKVVATALSQDVLIWIGFSVFGFSVIWSIITIFINPSVRYKNKCYKIIKFLRDNSVTSENYANFISLLQDLPASVRFAWKRYETARFGKASDYINQNEGVDLQMFGGLQKQNRSLMKSFIFVTCSLITLFSIAIVGSNSADGLTNAVITTSLVFDALIVPFVVYLLLIVNYYIYTAVRHQQYKLLVDTFYDLLDCLDEKVDIEGIFGKDTRAIGLIASSYVNETMESLIHKGKNDRNRNMNTNAVVRGNGNITPLNAGVIGVSTSQEPVQNNVISTDKMVSNRLSEPEQPREIMIRSEEQFVDVVNKVDALLAELDAEKDPARHSELEQEVNMYMKALTDYKQRAKKQN